MAETLWQVAELKSGLITISGFCNIVGQIVRAYNKLYLPDEKNHIGYYPAYPEFVRGESDKAPVDRRYIITYDIYRREDGTTGKDPFGRQKMRRLSLVGSEVTDSGGVREKYMKRFDNGVRFDCFAPTTAEATELVDVFETMLEIHRDFIISQGLDQMTYEGRLAPITFQRSKFRSKASLWYVREQKILFKDRDAISSIEAIVRDAADVEGNETFTRIIGDTTNVQED